jgi:hypothetical protein
MNNCAICINKISNINNCITPCGHAFCLECLLYSLRFSNACPLCRTEIEKSRDSQNISLDKIADLVYREQTNQDIYNKITFINSINDPKDRYKKLIHIIRDFAIYSCISMTE